MLALAIPPIVVHHGARVAGGGSVWPMVAFVCLLVGIVIGQQIQMWAERTGHRGDGGGGLRWRRPPIAPSPATGGSPKPVPREPSWVDDIERWLKDQAHVKR